MEKFDRIKYKGFETGFYITNKVKEFLDKNGISLDKLKERSDKDNEDHSFFYEVLLFEILDEDEGGKPDERFGKNFKVVYYKIAKEKRSLNSDLEHETLEEIKDDFEHDRGKVLNEDSKIINLTKNIRLEVKYKILRE